MKTLLLRDGDLVVNHRAYVPVTGTGKVAQDLRGAMLEPLGNDRFHPGWGSTLDAFIASIADETTRSDIEIEINRVIANYAAVQRDKIEADISGDTDTRFSTDEILSRIRGVSVTTQQDSVKVVVTLQTVSGEIITLNETAL